MLCNLIFKLRFSVLSFLTMSLGLVSYSVNSCLSSCDAPKRVDNCRLDNLLDLLAVGWSLSVGAFLFLDPEMTEHRLARKSFLSRLIISRLARLVAFLSSWAFTCLSFFSIVTNWEAGTGKSGTSALAFSLYIHGYNVLHQYGQNASLYLSFEESWYRKLVPQGHGANDKTWSIPLENFTFENCWCRMLNNKTTSPLLSQCRHIYCCPYKPWD